MVFFVLCTNHEEKFGVAPRLSIYPLGNTSCRDTSCLGCNSLFAFDTHTMNSALSSEGGSGVVDHRWSDDGSSVHETALDFELESSGLRVRRMQPGDLNAAADICIAAFNPFNASVGLGPEFPPRELVDIPYTLYAPGAEGGENGFAGFVCVDGSDSIVGANLLDFRDGVGGIGPVSSVASGAGKLLMRAAMKEAAERGVRSVRLLQVAEMGLGLV